MESLTTPQKAGHVLGFALGLANIASVGIPTGNGHDGPPLAVLIVGAVLGAIVIALLAVSWRDVSTRPRRIAAILLVLAALGALPGMFVGTVATGLRLGAGALILLTILTVVMLFSPAEADR